MADAGTINPEEKEHLDLLIQNITDHPQLKPFFGEDVTVFTETEIIHPSGFLSRPDRVVITSDKVIVIDYKTGLPASEHQKQVLHYGSLLRDMGYKHVDQYLLYLNDEISLIKVN
jgi:ATP-dependent exoDNAse (exonuclease V) beta subunit